MVVFIVELQFQGFGIHIKLAMVPSSRRSAKVSFGAAHGDLDLVLPAINGFRAFQQSLRARMRRVISQVRPEKAALPVFTI
jgi:hypothetical protein